MLFAEIDKRACPVRTARKGDFGHAAFVLTVVGASSWPTPLPSHNPLCRRLRPRNRAGTNLAGLVVVVLRLRQGTP